MNYVNLLDAKSQSNASHQEEFANEVKRGLSCNEKSIPSKFLYDDEGSNLFKEITALEEYYLTRTEMAIIQSFKQKLPQLLNSQRLDIIELGVGDGCKSSYIVDFFYDYGCAVNYYPIDISAKAFELLQATDRDYPSCNFTAIIADYIRGIEYTAKISNQRKLVLFLGSNIGNFSPSEAKIFLRTMHGYLNEGDFVLIGFDLKKDVALMQHAYDDLQGVTKEFNLNILRRMNKELGADFDVSLFMHHVIYNPRISAMESHLLSLKKQEIRLNSLNMNVNFEYLEPLHLECSFKFNPSNIYNLAQTTGYQLIHNFVDDNNFFADSLWKIGKATK